MMHIASAEFCKLEVNERNFAEKLREISDQYGLKVGFACKSKTLAKIIKKGVCSNGDRGRNATIETGATMPGVCKSITNGTMGHTTVFYTVYPNDRFPGVEELEGVDTELTAILYGGISCYQQTWRTDVIDRVYIIEYSSQK